MGTYLTNRETGGMGVSTATKTLTTQADSTLMTEWTREGGVAIYSSL
jgi:hypothetical protein